jgi:serine/threonine-protein kinase
MREVLPGETLDDYELIDVLARSGMASIFKARDSASGEAVVVKVPHPQLESDVVFFERFKREEAIGRKLEHPNIVRVLEPRRRSRPYMVMEFAKGKSLRALLSERAPLPRDEALAIAKKIGDALAYMHSRGIVHRDLKPENVLVDADGGGLKIIDFGIAMDDSARRLTWVGLSSQLGTPDYMAPEQIAGRRGDARTDVYALGTLLYEMLTGALPYDASNAQAYLRIKANQDPTPPSVHVPTIDRSLEAIILRAIERSPRDRYKNAQEMLNDLLNPEAVPPRDPDQPGYGRRRRLRLPPRFVLPATVLAILAALAALVWLSSTTGRGARRPSPSQAG